jgi:hypothetical protein
MLQADTRNCSVTRSTARIVKIAPSNTSTSPNSSVSHDRLWSMNSYVSILRFTDQHWRLNELPIIRTKIQATVFLRVFSKRRAILRFSIFQLMTHKIPQLACQVAVLSSLIWSARVTTSTLSEVRLTRHYQKNEIKQFLRFSKIIGLLLQLSGRNSNQLSMRLHSTALRLACDIAVMLVGTSV